jgi:hypothetical protein
VLSATATAVILLLLLQLCDLYENDCIFDKFGCCMNSPATCYASGTYSNTFKVSTVLTRIAAAYAVWWTPNACRAVRHQCITSCVIQPLQIQRALDVQ